MISAVFLSAAAFASAASAGEAPSIKLVAFGDSLSAGYLLPVNDAFPAVLEKALRADGYQVSVVNAGVSGDTASGGLARLDWTLGDGADAMILELGANDMLRGIDPDVTRGALDAILAELKARKIHVVIAGIKASTALGKDYCSRFDAIYPDLAAKYDAPLYPFFLAGVAGEPGLKLADGMHPNAAGVEQMVKGILPTVETLLKPLRDKAVATP